MTTSGLLIDARAPAMPEFLDLHTKTARVLRAATERAMRRHGLHLGPNYVLAVLWERDGEHPGEVRYLAGVANAQM